MGAEIFRYEKPFLLESGVELPALEIAYYTYGKLDKAAGNVIWICHALTANADAADWWPGMIGEGCLFDPAEKFIVCANILGSCYGTTGPLSVNPANGKPYYRAFPAITFRDVVNAHELLRDHIGIQKIHTIIGGSIGGAQALEYAIMFPDRIRYLVFVASSASYSPWEIAFNESQRMAIEADQTYFEDRTDGGARGMRAARSVALLSYRNDRAYNTTQAEVDMDKTRDFKACSYQQYQGAKLVKRFNAYSYYLLTLLSDTHNVGRGRGGRETALGQVKAKTLAIGITSDLLFPVYEQQYLVRHVKNSRYVEIDSLYGHDGFLIEVEKITAAVRDFWEQDREEHDSSLNGSK